MLYSIINLIKMLKIDLVKATNKCATYRLCFFKCLTVIKCLNLSPRNRMVSMLLIGV